jgi:hypothetical protein
VQQKISTLQLLSGLDNNETWKISQLLEGVTQFCPKPESVCRPIVTIHISLFKMFIFEPKLHNIQKWTKLATFGCLLLTTWRKQMAILRKLSNHEKIGTELAFVKLNSKLHQLKSGTTVRACSGQRRRFCQEASLVIGSAAVFLPLSRARSFTRAHTHEGVFLQKRRRCCAGASKWNESPGRPARVTCARNK